MEIQKIHRNAQELIKIHRNSNTYLYFYKNRNLGKNLYENSSKIELANTSSTYDACIQTVSSENPYNESIGYFSH